MSCDGILTSFTDSSNNLIHSVTNGMEILYIRWKTFPKGRNLITKCKGLCLEYEKYHGLR